MQPRVAHIFDSPRKRKRADQDQTSTSTDGLTQLYLNEQAPRKRPFIVNRSVRQWANVRCICLQDAIRSNMGYQRVMPSSGLIKIQVRPLKSTEGRVILEYKAYYTHLVMYRPTASLPVGEPCGAQNLTRTRATGFPNGSRLP